MQTTFAVMGIIGLAWVMTAAFLLWGFPAGLLIDGIILIVLAYMGTDSDKE